MIIYEQPEQVSLNKNTQNLKLLLRDIRPSGFQQRQHSRSDVSTAEVIRSQCREQNALSFTPHLVVSGTFQNRIR